jgi:hypothetical protein
MIVMAMQFEPYITGKAELADWLAIAHLAGLKLSFEGTPMITRTWTH